MATLPKELSPGRCHQLREGGFLRVLVDLLHKHTFETQDKPEADFNIEMFFMEFNGKAELRARSSNQLRTMVGHTAKNEHELKILGWLETLRKYVERLYNFMVGWKAMSEDPSKLIERINQLTLLSGEVEDVLFEILTADEATRPIFEQFGGVLVIVDYLRAQTRFNAKCHQFGLDPIDRAQLFHVAIGSKLGLINAATILYAVAFVIDPDIRDNKDIRLFLGDCRSLHEIMVGVAEDAYAVGKLNFVRIYCHFLSCLYDLSIPNGARPSVSHLKDCGVIKCLAKFGMEIKDPEILYIVLMALESPIALDLWNVLEFVSIDGAVDMLIDVLVHSKEKDEDVQNAEWYENQRQYSTSVLAFIIQRLLRHHDLRIYGRLLTNFESRDFAVILVRHLEQIASIHEYSPVTGYVFGLLGSILACSEDQRRKFTEIINGKEVVKRFESSDDERLARLSKRVDEVFERRQAGE